MRTEPKVETRYEAPVEKKTDYAVKSEITFDFEKEEPKAMPERPKINWAEKLQTAASKYDSQKSFETPSTSMGTTAPERTPERTQERPKTYQQENSGHSELHASNNANSNRENRIKSIAEKLGFFNFDEDEFDTPSFMKKNERNQDTQI
jgi:cell division protein FtsZ